MQTSPINAPGIGGYDNLATNGTHQVPTSPSSSSFPTIQQILHRSMWVIAKKGEERGGGYIGMRVHGESRDENVLQQGWAQLNRPHVT